jgi:hypothetical protein
MYTSGFLAGNTNPHWNGNLVSNKRRRSSLRLRNNSLLLSPFFGNSPVKRGACTWISFLSEYAVRVLGLLWARTLLPDVNLIPAHLGPMPIAMLKGDFNRRPHFLHLGCFSIVTSIIG